MGALTQSTQSWILQQIHFREQNVIGFLEDLSLLNTHPEYRNEFYNQEVIVAELRYQVGELKLLHSELERRVIP